MWALVRGGQTPLAATVQTSRNDRPARPAAPRRCPVSPGGKGPRPCSPNESSAGSAGPGPAREKTLVRCRRAAALLLWYSPLLSWWRACGWRRRPRSRTQWPPRRPTSAASDSASSLCPGTWVSARFWRPAAVLVLRKEQKAGRGVDRRAAGVHLRPVRQPRARGNSRTRPDGQHAHCHAPARKRCGRGRTMQLLWEAPPSGRGQGAGRWRADLQRVPGALRRDIERGSAGTFAVMAWAGCSRFRPRPFPPSHSRAGNDRPPVSCRRNTSGGIHGTVSRTGVVASRGRRRGPSVRRWSAGDQPWDRSQPGPAAQQPRTACAHWR
jgi:hypothetical protein